MNLSPQCTQIFNHLLRGGSISTMEAMRDFGCCRLSERIREIEATGIVIDRERVKIGRKTYTRYSYHKVSIPFTEGLGAEPLTDFAGVVWYP